MDARERLRQYLEQRRELGESELVLDGMSVDEVLRIVGAPVIPDAPRATVAVKRAASDPASANWRDALEAPATKPAHVAPPAPAPVTEPPREAPRDEPRTTIARIPVNVSVGAAIVEPPPGIIVGTAERALFGGPLDGVATLDAIKPLIAACTACALHATAKNPVPGEGNPRAQFVCVGEAPGESEDETGRPFVGKSGDLLTKILVAINLPREDVYICNVIKHRPPRNRNPTPDEIVACTPFLRRQLELLQPRVILALGKFAAQTLLGSAEPVANLRNRVHRYYGIPLIVTYHPAALLRNPSWKRPAWEDVQLARRILDRATNA